MAPTDEINGSPKRFKSDVNGPVTDEVPDEHSNRRKSRKSLGRRVSFAPTAHVRMFEIPEERQRSAHGNNMYELPDLSSGQANALGFNLGTISAAEETSMNSNESFDVSVRHSDPSDSLQSSGGSFAVADDEQNAFSGMPANNIIDDEDDDDDLEDVEGDDDAVTMELTGTVDMGAINNGDDDDEGEGEDEDAENIANHTGQTPTVDAESFLNMLMQGGGSSGPNIEQQTSLLDNIISQFGSDNTVHGTEDPSDIHNEQDTTLHVDAPVDTNNESAESDDEGDHDDAVTMELTGIVPRQPDESESQTTSSPPASTLWGQPMVSSFMDTIGSLLSTQPPSNPAAMAPQANAPTATPAPAEETFNDVPSTPKSAPARAATPRPTTMPKRTATPKRPATPKNAVSPAKTPQSSSILRAPMPRLTPTPHKQQSTPKAVKQTHTLDPLPPLPPLPHQFVSNTYSGPPTLADQAKAGLVVNIFDTYRCQTLIPSISAEAEQLSEVPVKFEPLYRKAQLSARLEYCSALSGLFEADRIVSEAAAAKLVEFDELVAFFEEKNEVLAQRRDELLLRISRARQKLAQEAPSSETGAVAGEIQSLRAQLGDIRHEREAIGQDIEKLQAEIQALQATRISADRQLTEKKSAQSILLAINGLQPAEVSESSCDFIYDKFSKLHFDDTADFMSLHPDIDWSAVVKSSIDADAPMRQYAIAIMKANVALKSLLEDVRTVNRHTFVELEYNDGIHIRMQFFSRKQRRRFYLQIPLSTIDSYAHLHEETRFEWPTDIVYGDLDLEKFKKCLRACKISPASPVLSIYHHIESSMNEF
ncbi:hypothetical protein LPJ78_000552 [Coemansia sp. RSA 989]|nr:hypothetical protein LPJ78_000552 [Coemansia sp. RSA 989]